MKGMFSADDAIGGNIVAHGCHFRVQFKTTGFSANNSLKRKGIIVDAPDLPPEDCEFYITASGLADTEKVSLEEIDQDDAPGPHSDLEIESLYEDREPEGSSPAIPITNISGIGKTSAKSLQDQGVSTIAELLDSDAKELAETSGLSEKMIHKWMASAKTLLS